MGKGVSAAEKKVKLLEVFHKGGNVFSSKEILKCNPGFPSGAIEGVLIELVSDDLVTEGKIGGAKFYWSFPGAQRMKKAAALQQLRAQLAKAQAQCTELTAKAEAARKASGQSEDEVARIRQAEEGIVDYKKREAEAIAEKDRLLKSSGSNMTLRKKDLPVLRDAANRWTDNLFELDKFMQEKCGMEKARVQKELGTGNLDYVEWSSAVWRCETPCPVTRCRVAHFYRYF